MISQSIRVDSACVGIVSYLVLFNLCSGTDGMITKDVTLNGCETNGHIITCNIIPRSLPHGTEFVYLTDLKIQGLYSQRTLRNGTFVSPSWYSVKHLTISIDSDGYNPEHYFESYCFAGLNNLEELHVHIRNVLYIRPDALYGLGNLKVVDFSRCPRLSLEEIISALDVLENATIDTLNVSSLYIRRSGLELNKDFCRVLMDRKVRVVDLSYTQIIMIDLASLLTFCDQMEAVILTATTILDWSSDDLRSKQCLHWKYVDASYVTFPQSAIRGKGPDDLYYKDLVVPVDLLLNALKPFLHLEYVDLSNVLPSSTTLSADNVTIYFMSVAKFAIKTVVIRGNNVDRLNAKVIAPNNPLESLDASDCSISFIHPDITSAFPSLKYLNLSSNNLQSMAHENMTLFSRLFENMTKLENLSLAGNGLIKLSNRMFVNNHHLSSIDVSNNKLEELGFLNVDLLGLKHLNIRGNLIQTLDDSILTKLNVLFRQYSKTTADISIDLRNNPIKCSDCKSFNFIAWILHHDELISKQLKTTCVDDVDNVNTVNKQVMDEVRMKCDTPKAVWIIAVSVSLSIICVIGLVFLIRCCYRERRREVDIDERIQLIREGAAEREFVVFLSFSSEDEDFVTCKIREPLTEKLEEMIAADRDLVCDGDTNFRAGHSIHDEMSKLLKRSIVVLVVLTDNYLDSPHCRTEFDQALTLEKHIILIIKDKIDIDRMMPAMRDIYDTRTRILWKYENGEYVLKTSWDNVCTSILELR